MFENNLDYAKKNLQRYPFPKNIIVEPTAYCNMRCVMCPQSIMTRKRGTMEFSTFKKIVDEVVAKDTKARIWLAIVGEPLLLGDKLLKMISYGRDKGLDIYLNTNAELLDRNMSFNLIGSGVKEIIVSLDAITKETYDKIRIGGHFDEVMKNVNFLLSIPGNSVKITAQLIVMDDNEKEIETFKNYWLSRGAIVKIRQRMGWGTGVERKELEKLTIERFPCAWLMGAVSIHWDGSFAQCDADFDGKHSPGNILTQTIQEVWDGKINDLKEKHFALDFSHPLCSVCKDWVAGTAERFYPK